MALPLNSSFKRLAIRGLIKETHDCTMVLFIIPTLEEEVCVFEMKLKEGDYVGDDMEVLWENRGSC